jgi:hypothetical protein
MSDIVHRLRRTASLGIVDGGLMEEAAEEIERIRAALQKIIDDADSDDGATAWDGSEIARAALSMKT